MIDVAGKQTGGPAEGKRVSYSHDSDAHRPWIRSLAEYLIENRIDVVLDQWDVRLGDDLPAFMEKAVRDTDRVIAICTDSYIEKANSGAGGIGYEKTIATAEIVRDHKSRRRFIPVVRDVTSKEKMRAYFGAAFYFVRRSRVRGCVHIVRGGRQTLAAPRLDLRRNCLRLLRRAHR